MAIILHPTGTAAAYLLRALGEYKRRIDDEPGKTELAEAVLALLLALVDAEPLLITDQGRLYVAEAVLFCAAQHGRCAESEAIIAELAPLGTAQGGKA